MIDRFGRVIDTLRISVTDRCNFKCLYCWLENIFFNKKEEILKLEEILDIVKIFLNLGVKKIKITGGEPFLRRNISFILNEISKLKEIEDISITTNGFFLSEFISEIKKTKIKRINVSLDTLDREKFKFIAGIDGFEKVIDGIEKAVEDGFKLKINVVLLKGINDDEIFEFLKFGDFYKIAVRFIELMPTENKFLWEKYFISGKEVIRMIEGKYNIKFIEREKNFSPNTIYFKVENYKGIYGIITPLSRPFCNMCNRIRLTTDGRLFLCLSSEKNLDLRYIIRKDRKFIEEKIMEFIYNEKPERHNMVKEKLPFLMCKIGG
ncbi:MAG: GTP 3',8-cyclase MoaA [Candidatus Ratteibacteria bacterium]